jgi:hypothetical protein
MCSRDTSASANICVELGKEATKRCHHCDTSANSAQHTLEHCPAWAAPRHSLTGEIGCDLSPPAMFEVLLASERGRKAVASFCELVMLRKEAAQRVRERESHSERIGRRGRSGVRGRAYTGRVGTTATSDGWIKT